MKEAIAALVQVQQLDERLAVLHRRLESLPEELAEREAHQSAQAAEADSVEGQRKAALARSRDLENEVRKHEERVAKLTDQINNTRDAGAVQVAQHEVQELRDRIASSEEEAIRLLENAERLVETREEARSRAQSAADDLELFRKTVSEDQAELEREIGELQTDRDRAVAKVPKNVAEVYEKLRPARKGRALAPLKGQSCGGCGMVVPPNDRIRVSAQSSMVRCRSCTRILVPVEAWNGATATETNASE